METPEALFSFSFDKDQPFARRRAIIKETIRDEMRKDGIEIAIDDITLEAPMPCGCPPLKMSLEDIPLEDISCPCGRTKIFKFSIN